MSTKVQTDGHDGPSTASTAHKEKFSNINELLKKPLTKVRLMFSGLCEDHFKNMDELHCI